MKPWEKKEHSEARQAMYDAAKTRTTLPLTTAQRYWTLGALHQGGHSEIDHALRAGIIRRESHIVSVNRDADIQEQNRELHPDVFFPDGDDWVKVIRKPANAFRQATFINLDTTAEPEEAAQLATRPGVAALLVNHRLCSAQ